MSDTFYKPLTPAFRSDINKAIDNNIADLRTCQSNAIVISQIFMLMDSERLSWQKGKNSLTENIVTKP